jgi:hypothetical protein
MSQINPFTGLLIVANNNDKTSDTLQQVAPRGNKRGTPHDCSGSRRVNVDSVIIYRNFFQKYEHPKNEKR